jgi:outer membrane protein assembly factor BamB
MFYAIDANTGQTIWSQQLGTVSTACMDLPGGVFGITGTATIDRSTNRVYVADGHDLVHALDLQTGTESAGWPVTIDNKFNTNHVYGALTLNPANGLLYVSTGSFCDYNQWTGHITAVNTSSASVVAQFFPAAPYTGGGVWGMGGAAIDASNNVYIGTGNTWSGPADTSAYGDHLVQLDPNLNVLAADSDSVAGDDVDFGATPMLYRPPGCSLLTAIKGKTGVYPVYNAATIASGPLQSLVMSTSTPEGQFIGVTAYSPATNLVYVGDPVGNSTFTHGLVALAPQPDCTLALAWQQTFGVVPAATSSDNDTPLVANGVVYFADGRNNTVDALDAQTGALLWNSGNAIGGPVMSAPVVDGRLFIGSWNGVLYAFGL